MWVSVRKCQLTSKSLSVRKSKPFREVLFALRRQHQTARSQASAFVLVQNKHMLPRGESSRRAILRQCCLHRQDTEQRLLPVHLSEVFRDVVPASNLTVFPFFLPSFCLLILPPFCNPGKRWTTNCETCQMEPSWYGTPRLKCRETTR